MLYTFVMKSGRAFSVRLKSPPDIHSLALNSKIENEDENMRDASLVFVFQDEIAAIIAEPLRASNGEII